TRHPLAQNYNAQFPSAPSSPSSSAPLPSRPCPKSATYIDFVNPLLWVQFTNLAFSLSPSILRATSVKTDRDAVLQRLILVLAMMLFLLSKLFEVFTVADLLLRSHSLSSRTVITIVLLAAYIGLLAPMFISELTFAQFSFMLWSVTLGVFFGICLAFGLGRSESAIRMVTEI
ncbi:hypothetical protein V1520DRAFT_344286, partial [Lipomyces starkeyi]